MTLDYNGKKIEITQPMGSGGSWHVMVDNYFHGQIVMNNGAPVAYLNNTFLTGDDLGVIIDLISQDIHSSYSSP